MKKNVLNLSLLAGAILATGVIGTACSGGDDDDDDDGGGRPVVLQEDGGAADFTSCAPITGSNGNISLKVFVGKQGLDTSAAPAATPGSIVTYFNPLNSTTGAASAPTDASGLTNVTVPANTLAAFKVYHPTDGTTTFVDGYDYGRLTPATSNTNGDAVFDLRIIPTAVRNAIAAILGPPVDSLAGLTSFAGSVTDCSGEAIVGATLELAGTGEPNRCSSSATLPCVAYSTDTGEDFTDESAQVFMLGLPGSGSLTLNVMGVVADGGAPVQIGSLTIVGRGDTIALGAIPAQNVP
jgi:hypothetical protein